MIETVFRSDELPVDARFEAWREMMRRTHVPLLLDSDRPAEFVAEQRVLSFGAGMMRVATMSPVHFRRTRRLVTQSDPEWVHLSMARKGRRYVAVGEQATVAGPSLWQVLDTSRPLEIHTTGAAGLHAMVGVDLPKALLPLPRARVDQLVGRLLPGHEGFGGVLRETLGHLARGSRSYGPADGPRWEELLVSVVTSFFAQSLGADMLAPPEMRQQAVVLRMREFVQQNLRDPELNPRTVAAAHHISVSHLHRLFKDEDETLAALIRRLRLERARRDLVDPLLSTTPVHAVAARWGFANAAHFTRTFRAAYGTTPSDCRQGRSCE
ncbi:helix-turn-helix domain-containing protein [Kribbella albertanoniae]|uniref:Helix-turn-helix domain-containing protein n=1 Tax=Kribbella albertanoniae TaxID=1266829 RepID=A0A4R4P825_9ACTN|nr:helix-turn-helix domain-containing protein [Kribbella albertanoniae]TDC17043.1 helix-turn-helix domain-containing protein [Kribbella albertanoniae]